MNKQELLKSASQLKQPSSEAVAEFSSKTDEMTNILNHRFTKYPDIVDLKLITVATLSVYSGSGPSSSDITTK